MKRFFAALVCAVSVCSLSPLAACSSTSDGVFYDISCSFDGSCFSIDERVDFPAQKDGLEEVVFNVYPPCFEEGVAFLRNGRLDDEKDLGVTAVEIDGRDAEYFIEGNALTVKTYKNYDTNEKISVKIKLDYDLPLSDKRFARTENTVNFGNFFPTLAVWSDGRFVTTTATSYGDPFFSAVASFKVTVTVPSTYVVATGANAVSLDVDDDKTQYVYEPTRVRDFAFALSEKYEVKSEKWGNKSINYYYYDDQSPEKTVGAAIEALKYFSSIFGEYPYDGFCVAQTTFSVGGMEYPQTCFLSDKLDDRDRVFALVHETAHQWWYAVVGNDQSRESFLDESLAEYSSYLFFDEHPEYGVSGDELVKNAAHAANVCENSMLKANPDFIPAVSAPLESFGTEYVYVNMVYDKGLVMMKAAENSVGRKKLVKSLERYFEKYAFSIADGQAFVVGTGAAKPIILSFLDGKTRVFI